MAENPSMKSKDYNTAAGTDLVPIVPNNVVDLATPARAIRCKPLTGEAGAVRFMAISGEVRTTEIDVGEWITVQVARVYEDGTTATGLEALI